MSFASTSTRPTSKKSALRRSALIVSAGLFAGALSLGGAVAASAASSATVTSSASTATANGQVTVTADGFAANESLTVTFDSSALTTYADSAFTQDEADATGHYVATAYLPSSATVGAHTITVTGATTAAVSTPITIVASPTGAVTPSTVAVSAYLSTGVTVNFTGFTAGDSVSFGMGNQGSGGPVGSPVTVGASGIATLSYVPTAGSSYSGEGTYTFSAFTADGAIVARPATLTVTADAVAAAPAPIAGPATPVKQTASFTG